MRGQSKLWSILIPIFFLLSLAGSFSDQVRHSFSASDEMGGGWTLVNLEDLFGTQNTAQQNPEESQILPIGQIANATGGIFPLVAGEGTGGSPPPEAQGGYDATAPGEGWDIVPIEQMPQGNETTDGKEKDKEKGKGACERLGLENAYCSEKEETILIQDLENTEISLGTIFLDYTEIIQTKDKIEFKTVNTKLLLKNISNVGMKDATFKGDEGTIYFKELNINSVKEQKEISAAITISKNHIGIDTVSNPELDQPAQIEFYNVYGLKSAHPLRNGGPCGTYCSNFTYDPNTGIASMEVSGFSNYSIEGINISSAIHLDSSYGFISDITEYVRNQDNNWSEQIPAGDFVRVTFEENLTNGKVIDTYARKGGASNVYFDVYENGTTSPLLGSSGPLTDAGEMSYITIENMSGEADTFDFQMMGDSGGYAEFDYIHDTDVGACMVISTSGEYNLTTNLVGSITTPAIGDATGGTVTGGCIIISASDVLIDCNGSSITNNATSTDRAGILINGSAATPRTNITIQNCPTITGYEKGVYFYQSRNNLVKNTTTISNTVGTTPIGVYLSYTNYTNLTNCTFASNTYGIRTFYSSDNNITNSSIYSNPSSNVYIHTSSTYNSFIGNNVSGGSPYGFYIQAATATYNTFADNLISGHTATAYGISIASNSNTMINNTITSNAGYGIFVGGVSYNKIINNTIYGNTGSNAIGIYLSAATTDYSTVIGNNVSSNALHGIQIRGSYNNLTDNHFFNNTRYGIWLYEADNNNITNNTAKENNIYDLQIYGPSADSYCTNEIVNLTGSGDLPILYSNSAVTWSDQEASEIVLCNAGYSSVTNVNVSGSDDYQNNGVLILRSNNTNLTNVNSSGNDQGFYAYASNYSNLVSCFAQANVNGFNVSTSTGFTVNDSISTNNAQHCFFATGITGARFNNNTAAFGCVNGFAVYSSLASNSIFANNTAYNTTYGFDFEATYPSTYLNLTGNEVSNTTTAFYLNGADYLVLANNSAHNNSNYGIYLVGGATYGDLIGNRVFNNSQYGIYLATGSDYNEFIGNSVFKNGYDGFYVTTTTSDTRGNNFTNNMVYENGRRGFYFYTTAITAARLAQNLVNNTIHSNNLYGVEVYIFNITMSNDTLYNNSEEIRIYKAASTTFTFTANNIIITNPYGTLVNYTNLSIYDIGEGAINNYSIKWTRNSAGLPSANYFSFEQKFVNITTGTGAPSLDRITWHWTDDEVALNPDYDDSKFELWKYNASGWGTALNTTPGLDNTLSIYNHDPSSMYAILQNNATDYCKVISAPGAYSMLADYAGAPYDASPAIQNACVVIASSDVSFNCGSYAITNNGTADAAAIVVNGTSDSPYARINITNCAKVSGYLYGINVQNASLANISSPAAYNNTYGIFSNNSPTLAISSPTVHNNTYGLYLLDSNATLFSKSTFYNNALDLVVNSTGAAMAINATEALFQDPSGAFVNYTNLSFYDSISAAGAYSVSWERNDSSSIPPDPPAYFSFRAEFVNITKLSGDVSIEEITWRWANTEATGIYNEVMFELWKSNSSGWALINSTPDTTNNWLKQYNMNPGSKYGILQETPGIFSINLTSTNGTNRTGENLTVQYNYTTPLPVTVKNTTTWYLNGTSLMSVNMPFEAGSSCTFTENYGSGSNGTGTAGTCPTWGAAYGYDGWGGYSCPGVDEFLNTTNIPPTSAGTITIWFKAPANQLDTNGTIFGQQNTATTLATTASIRTSDEHLMWDFDNRFADAGDVVNDSKWHMLAMRWGDGTGFARLYLDGVETSTIIDDGVHAFARPLYVCGLRSGTGIVGDRYLIGYVDELQLYTRALSVEQIVALYQNRTDLIVSQETEIGDTWQACVDPNNGTADLARECSNTLVIAAEETSCKVITTSGTTTFLKDEEGAPNPVTGVDGITDACVVIAASDVLVDCAGYTLTNDGTANAAAIAANGSSEYPLTNITIKNCPSIAGYSRGVDLHYTSTGGVQTSSLFNNTGAGIYLYNSTYLTVSNITVLNSTECVYLYNSTGNAIITSNATNCTTGFHAEQGSLNNFTSSRTYRTAYGFTVNNSDNTILTTNNCTNATGYCYGALSDGASLERNYATNATTGFLYTTYSNINSTGNDAYGLSGSCFQANGSLGQSENLTFTSNTARNCGIGFWLGDYTHTTMVNNTASASGYGISLYHFDNATMQNNTFYNSTYYDMEIVSNNSVSYLGMANSTFRDPYGALDKNYTSLSISDLIGDGAYSINWTRNSTTIPAGYISFANKFVQITFVSGTISVDSATWLWAEEEVTGEYADLQFELWTYNTSAATWAQLNATPNTAQNTLSAYGFSSSGEYGILQNTNSSCRVYDSPGSSTLSNNIEGAPATIGGIADISKACIVISTSDLLFDCNGFNITNDGTPDAAGIIINSSSTGPFTGIIIRNCPGVSGYEKGIYAYNSSRSTISNSTSFNSSEYGIGLSGSDRFNLSLTVARNNTLAGVYIYGGYNNSISNSSAYNNSGHGFSLESTTRSTVNLSYAYNNTQYGIYIHSGELNAVANTSAYNNKEGLNANASSNCSFHNNQLYSNEVGFHLYSSDDSIVSSQWVHNNSVYGSHINNSDGVSVTSDVMYANGLDFIVDGGAGSDKALALTDVIFPKPSSSPGSPLGNYTNLTLEDEVGTSTWYWLNWSASPAALPSGYTSFKQKYVKFWISGGNVTDISWKWSESEIEPPYDEGLFELWLYNASSSWQNLNILVNTTGNSLTYDEVAADGTYAILQYLGAEPVGACMLISGSGNFTLTADLVGSPIDVPHSTREACISIDSSDVLLDCKGHSITNDGTVSAVGIIVDGDGTHQYSGITIQNCDGVAEYSYGILLKNTTGSRVYNSTPHDNSYGIYLDYSSNNDLVNNTAYNNTEYSDIYLSYSPDNTLINNTAYTITPYLGDGFNIRYSPNTLLIGNTAYDLSGPCFHIRDSPGSTLINNTGYNCTTNSYEGAIYIYQSSNTTATGNHMYDAAIGIASLHSNYTRVLNNTVHDSTAGIDLHDSHYCNVENNSAYDAGAGICISTWDSSNAYINNNNVSNCTYGIYLNWYGDNTTVSNNTISNNSDTAIYVEEITNATVVRNTIIDDLELNDVGIDVDCSKDGLIAHNNILIADIGIHISASCVGTAQSTNNTIFNNTIFAEGGIYAGSRSSYNFITNNTILCRTIGSADDGLTASEDENNTFANNTVMNCSSGIYAYFTENDTFSGNTFYNMTEHDGIYMYESKGNLFADNVIYNSTEHGVYIYGGSTNNTFINNTISNSTLNGIDIRLGCSYNNFTNNTISNSGQHGMIFYGAWHSALTNNIVHTNSLDGISINDSDYVSLIGNTAYNSGRYGFEINLSQYGTLINNTAHNNTRGFHLYLSNNTAFFNTTAYGNSQYGIFLNNSNNTNFTDTHIYNNAGWGILLGTGRISGTFTDPVATVYFLNLSIDNPAGNYVNYTRLDISDTVEQNTTYRINWTTNSSSLPGANTISFRQKWANISVLAGNVSIGEITWNWDDSEVNSTSGYNESIFELWKYNSTGWTMLNDTPDTAANTLKQYDMRPASDYGILQYNASENCPVITSSGDYVQTINYSGAPNNASEVSYGATACVKITASDVAYDCNGYDITNNGTAGTTYGILLRGPLNNVTIRNCPGVSQYHTGIYLYQSNYSALINNSAYNNTWYGIYLSPSSNSNALTNNTAYNNSQYGIYLYQSNSNTLTNNSAYNNPQHGIYLYQSNYSALTSNNAYNNSYYGIYLGSSSGNNLTSNTAHNNTQHGFLLSSSSSNNLTSNSAYNNSLYGIFLSNSNLNNLTSNNAYNNSQNGLYLSSSSYNTLANNTAFNNTGSGIYLSSSSNSNALTSNSAYNNTNGISLSSSSNSNALTSNSAYNNTQHGIYLFSSSNNNFTSNSAYNNSWYGIYLESSSNNTLANNSAYNNGGTSAYAGIYLSSSSSNNTLTSNSAYNNSRYGIRISSSSNNTLTSNSAYNNTLYGIYLTSSSNNDLTSNSAYNNTLYGIYLSSSSYNNLTNNSAYKNGGTSTYAGIYLSSSSSNNLTSNSAYNNSRYGIYLTSSSNSNALTNNSAYNNSGYGIYLSSSSSNNLTSNSAYNNGGTSAYAGIYLFSSSNSNTLTSNSAYNNSYYGIYLSSSSNNNLTSNNAYNNSYYGFLLSSSSSNTLTSNSAYNNSQYGFYLESSSNSNALTSNSAYNNTQHGFYLTSSSYNNLTNNSAYNNGGTSAYAGIYLTSSSNSNNLTSNSAYNNSQGIAIYLSNNMLVSDPLVYNNALYGISINDSNSTVISGAHFYNNGRDFRMQTSTTPYEVNLTNAIFDNPYGNIENFTNISLFDIAAANSIYSINWTTNSTSLPADTISFAQKFINISTVSGTASINKISWSWDDSELSGYNETRFEIWKYNAATGWSMRNGTPDTSNNTLSLYNMNPASDYGILENNAPENCPLIEAPGQYVQGLNYTGAPNDASEVAFDSYACVKITASDVEFDCGGLSITGNDSLGTTQYGVLVYGPLTNVTLKNCIVSSYDIGIYPYQLENSSFENNSAYNNAYGIYTLSSSNNNLTSNSAQNSSQYGFYLSSSDSNTLANNTAYDGSLYGFYFDSSPNNIIANNTCRNNSQYGFYLSSSDSNTLANNTAYDGSLYGFYIYGSNHLNLTDNTAYNNAQDGFDLDGSTDNTLASNNAYNNTVNGFLIYLNSDYNNLTSNNAYDNAQIGIYLYASTGNNLTDNNAYNNTGSGIYLYSSSNFNTIANNNANNNSQYGIYLGFSTDNALTNNTANTNLQYGIYLSSSNNNNLTDNTANTNGGTGFYAGIHLMSSSNNNLINNFASGNSMRGIFIGSSSSNNLINNTAISSPQFGILLQMFSSSNNLINNSAYNNSQSGILIQSNCNFNNLTNNNASGNGGSGIYLQSGTSSNLSSNTASFNNQSGIYIQAFPSASFNNNTLADNTANSNLQYGIYLQVSSNNTLTNNSAQNNSRHGFYIFSGAHNNTLTSNTASNNNWTGIYIYLSNNALVSNPLVYNNALYGISINNSNSTVISGARFHNNSLDFWMQTLAAPYEVNLTNAIFDNPYGNLENFTNLSLFDTAAASSSYALNWTTNSAALPAQTMSFAQKFINISTIAGNASIDTISWSWDDSELPGYNETWFGLWKYNSSAGWSTLNETPDTENNTLTLYDMNPASEYGILEYKGTECTVINESGDYQLIKNLEGASIPVTEGAEVSWTCIKIKSANVTLDCNGYNITNNGTADAAGIIGVTPDPEPAGDRNVTIMNCPGVSQYETGVYLFDKEYGVYNTTSFNNSNYGFYVNNCSHADLENNTAYGNAKSGIHLNYANYTNLTGNQAYNNTQHGFSMFSGSSNRFINITSYNNTEDGFFANFSDGAIIDPSRFHDNNGNGVNLNNCNGSTLDNVTVNDNKGHGLQMVGTDSITILNSEFCRNHQYGIRLHPGTNTNISNSVICDNTERGIHLEDSTNLLVNGSSIYGNPVGVGFLHSSANTVDPSYLFNNTVGINITDTNYTAVDDSYIYNNSYGIWISGANNTLINRSAIYNNAIYGIYQLNSDHTNSTNTNVTNNTVGGISLDAGSESNAFYDNFVCYNGFDITNASAYTTGTLDYCDTFLGWSENGHPGCAFVCTEIWHVLYGNMSGKLVLAENNSAVFEREWAAVGYNVYAVNTNRSPEIVWPSLLALGRNTSIANSTDDFTDLDTVLSLTTYPDNVGATFSYDGSNPRSTIDREIYRTLVSYVPVSNSTSSATFLTGILWDSSQGGTEFNPGDNQDVVFFAPVNASQNGSYGTYDYELKIPAPLATYKGGATVDIYLELR